MFHEIALEIVLMSLEGSCAAIGEVEAVDGKEAAEDDISKAGMDLDLVSDVESSRLKMSVTWMSISVEDNSFWSV